MFSPMAVDYRGHDIHHSGSAETQANSERKPIGRWNGDAALRMSVDVS